MKTPLSSMLLVLLGSFIGSFGAVFLKTGGARLAFHWRALLLNWHLTAGVIAYLLSSVFFVLAIKHGELTILYPMASLGYIWTLLWSKLFFQEPLTKSKFLGLGLILSGVLFLNLGNK